MIIGFTGKAGSGKDTAADYLVTHHGFVKLSFAGPLKAMLAAGGMPEPKHREEKEALVPGFLFTWREAAQKLGTEWGRSLDLEIWLKMMEQQIVQSQSHNIALSDLRYENEAAMVRRLGGVVVHMAGAQADLGVNAGHASEAGVAFSVLPLDIKVDNSKSHAWLYGQLDAIMGGWL